MCGLVGVVLPEGTERVDRVLLERMRDDLRHRGPDDAGTWLDDPPFDAAVTRARVPRCSGSRAADRRSQAQGWLQPALRFFRLTATLPHSEKPRTFTRGAPGRPCSFSR